MIFSSQLDDPPIVVGPVVEEDLGGRLSWTCTHCSHRSVNLHHLLKTSFYRSSVFVFLCLTVANVIGMCHLENTLELTCIVEKFANFSCQNIVGRSAQWNEMFMSYHIMFIHYCTIIKGGFFTTGFDLT